MASKLVGKVQALYYNGYNISGESNSVNLKHGIEDVPSDNFGATYKDHEPGLGYCSGEVGIMLPGDHTLEGALSTGFGLSTNVFSIFADGTSASSTAFALKGLSLERTRSLKIGELYSTMLNLLCKGSPGLLRGKVLEAVISRAASANTAGIQFTGGVSSSQSLYIAYHVLQMTGTSLDAVLQRDDNSGFTSALTAITMSNFTAIGAELKSLAGPLTDDWFRLSFTLNGAGNYTVAAVIAVQ